MHIYWQPVDNTSKISVFPLVNTIKEKQAIISAKKRDRHFVPVWVLTTLNPDWSCRNAGDDCRRRKRPGTRKDSGKRQTKSETWVQPREPCVTIESG